MAPPRSPMHRTTLLPVLALVALADVAGAQTPRGSPARGAAADSLLEEGDRAHAALRPLDALGEYLRILDSEPDRYAALWRAARETVNLGMLASDSQERKARYAQAERYARSARAAAPSSSEGAEWLAIALGSEARDAGPRMRVRLAVEARDVALAALALDSANAGAHHFLGEWNAEVMRLSGVERWLARRLLGGSIFEEASWEEAERHLRASVALDPRGLMRRLDLARTCVDLGRLDEARALLREVLERPAVEPVDPLHKQAARELLRALNRDGPSGQPDARLSP